MKMTNASTALIDEIKTILAVARQQAATAVNFAMVEAYWLMGKRIVEEEQNGTHRAQYGESLIKHLSKALVTEFGQGFSVANLKNFRKFYLVFQGDGKGYALCSLFTQTEKLRELRKTLINDVVTGKIKVVPEGGAA